MIFEERTFEKMNDFIRDSQDQVAYLVLLFNITSKEPYLGVIYHKDNVKSSELTDMLLYMYGVIIYDYNKIDFYLEKNNNIPNLSTYIKEAVKNKIQDSRKNTALNDLFQSKLYNVEEDEIKYKIQSIYKNDKLAKNYIKTIKQNLKSLDTNFMQNGIQYDSSNISPELQKKNLSSILKPIISDLVWNNKSLCAEIEDIVYSFFFKTLDINHSAYEYTYNNIVRGKFDKYISNKVSAKGIELLAIQNDRYLSVNLRVLETEIFHILNKLSDIKKPLIQPTIEPKTTSTFNTIVNNIQYYNIYNYNYSIGDTIHKMGIDTIYLKFLHRDLRVQLKINTDFNYAKYFRKYVDNWQDMNVALYSHLIDNFASKLFRRDILEHSRSISYKIVGVLKYTFTQQDVIVYNDKYKKSYDKDCLRHADLLGNIMHNEALSKTQVEELTKEFNELEYKYKKVA